jgi:phospholipid-binding lipoprotein MlaA
MAASPESLAAAQPEVQAEPAIALSLLDRFNHAMFAFNRFVYEQLSTASAPPAEPSPGSGGVGNMLSNLINEPISMLASTIAGDTDGIVHATQRFSINSTLGWLGYYDRASELGIQPDHRDLGLAFCARGVPAGPYVVLSFVGPRTLRDALTDIVLVNLALYSAASLALGQSAGLSTVLLAESVEIAADIIATRQIDPNAKAIDYTDFDGMKQTYLEQRGRRCAELAATIGR